MVDYTWVAWFEELATTIARNGERDLADKAKAVDWKKDSVPLLNYRDKNIDPMSFLYFLAQKKHRETVQGRLRKRPRGVWHHFGFSRNSAFHPCTLINPLISSIR